MPRLHASLDSITSDKRIHEIAKVTYPIKVVIDPELFDVSIARKKTFWSNFENEDKIGYKMLFYFSPYGV